MRVELKYKSNYLELRRIIINLRMTKQYPNRIINSIYFDDHKKTNYIDSLEGTVPRKKIRFRWYGNQNISELTKGTFEIKSTYSSYRDKQIFKLNSFDFNFIKIKLNELMPSLTKPICKIVYYREYFHNAKGHRMTLDTNLKYFKVNNLFEENKFYIDNSNIAELKIDKNEDYEKVSSSFENLRVRNSKYCNAVESIYL